jgi:hypothetical protein
MVVEVRNLLASNMKSTKMICFALLTVFYKTSSFKRELLNLIDCTDPVVCVPSSFFIGDSGIPLEVIAGSVSADELVTRIHKVQQVRRNQNLFYFKILFGGWRDGSAVKSTDCSSQGTEFKSLQPHSGLQPFVMRSDSLFWSVRRQLQCSYI